MDMEKFHDPLEIQQIELNVNEEDIVIDVGANIGLVTLPLSKFVKKNGKVYAFEPHPQNFEILSKNVAINSIKNIILENKAVSNYNGSAKLFDSWAKNEDGAAKLFRTEGQPSDFTETPVITLDTYFENIKLIDKISFVKIDVEGVEYDVIMGMKKILEKNPKIQLIIEFIPRQLIAYGANPKEMLNFLISMNFKIYWFDYSKDKKMKIVDDVDGLIKGYPYQSVNILCKRN
jgi:FkbM family methyltransferase